MLVVAFFLAISVLQGSHGFSNHPSILPSPFMLSPHHTSIKAHSSKSCFSPAGRAVFSVDGSTRRFRGGVSGLYAASFDPEEMLKRIEEADRAKPKGKAISEEGISEEGSEVMLYSCLLPLLQRIKFLLIYFLPLFFSAVPSVGSRWFLQRLLARKRAECLFKTLSTLSLRLFQPHLLPLNPVLVPSWLTHFLPSLALVHKCRKLPPVSNERLQMFTYFGALSMCTWACVLFRYFSPRLTQPHNRRKHCSNRSGSSSAHSAWASGLAPGIHMMLWGIR